MNAHSPLHAISEKTPRYTAAVGEDTLSKLGATMKFARNTEIFGEEEDAEFLYRVVSGAVRIVKFLNDGRRQIGSFHFAGEVFGIEPAEVHTVSAEAISDCVILVINKEVAFAHAKREPELAFALWQATLKDLARAQGQMILLGRKTASERVASFLLDMANRSVADGLVELPMSRYDIADHLGLTIETVSRSLSEMEHSGMIALRTARRLELSRRPALERLDA